MFLKAESIILKSFPTCGSKISSITFELHFDYFFAYFCNLENSKHKPKIAKTQQRQVKNGKSFGKNSAKLAKIKIYYDTDGS